MNVKTAECSPLALSLKHVWKGSATALFQRYECFYIAQNGHPREHSRTRPRMRTGTLKHFLRLVHLTSHQETMHQGVKIMQE